MVDCTERRGDSGKYGESLIFGVLFAALLELASRQRRTFFPRPRRLSVSPLLCYVISSRLCWAVLVPRSEEFCSCVL